MPSLAPAAVTSLAAPASSASLQAGASSRMRRPSTASVDLDVDGTRWIAATEGRRQSSSRLIPTDSRLAPSGRGVPPLGSFEDSRQIPSEADLIVIALRVVSEGEAPDRIVLGCFEHVRLRPGMHRPQRRGTRTGQPLCVLIAENQRENVEQLSLRGAAIVADRPSAVTGLVRELAGRRGRRRCRQRPARSSTGEEPRASPRR
jgi:hypothetical protein